MPKLSYFSGQNVHVGRPVSSHHRGRLHLQRAAGHRPDQHRGAEQEPEEERGQPRQRPDRQDQ